MRRAALAFLVVAAPLVTARPAFGACDGPIPSFREVVRSAETVIVGTVVSVDPTPDDPAGYASVFGLRVDHVLRGRSDPLVTIDHLALSPCSTQLKVPMGATIALALDGHAFTPPMDVNAPAFVSGRSYESTQPRALSEPETATLAEVYQLVGVPLPSTATATPSPPTTLAGLLLLALAVALAARPVTRGPGARRRSDLTAHPPLVVVGIAGDGAFARWRSISDRAAASTAGVGPSRSTSGALAKRHNAYARARRPVTKNHRMARP